MLLSGMSTSVAFLAFAKKCLECPICLDLMTDREIAQCSNGHLICGPCHQSVQNCPVCRVKLSRLIVRSRIAEQLAEKLHIMRPNSSVEAAGKDELEAHIKNSNFAKYPCPQPTCKALLGRELMVEHLTSQHQAVMQESTTDGTIVLSLEPHLGQDNRVWPPKLAIFRNVHFMPTVYKIGNIYYCWLRAMADCDIAGQFEAQLSVERSDGAALPCLERSSPLRQNWTRSWKPKRRSLPFPVSKLSSF